MDVLRLDPEQKLSPGRYSYKFIVDGVWRHSDNSPTVSDGAGGFNNTVSIEGTPEAWSREDAARTDERTWLEAVLF